MMNSHFVNTLSPHLFWDVDISEIDEDVNSKYIVSKVLQYGLYADFEKIVKYYGLMKIVELATNIRGIDKKTVSFLSTISGVSKNKFSCYITEQSNPQHWNF